MKSSIASAIAALLLFSGCQKLSSIPTAEDNFIIVPPINLFVLSAHDASVYLQWSGVGAVGFSYYNIYYGTDKAHLNFEAQSYTNLFYVDSLNYNSTYYFEVTAVYANGAESGPSNIVSAKPINYFAPTQPSGLVVLGHNDNQGRYMTVAWSPNFDGDLAGYELYRGTTGSFQPDTTRLTNLVATLTTVSYIDTTNLALGTEYYYKVIAFDFAHWRSIPSSPDSDIILRRPIPSSPSDGATLSANGILTFTYSQVPYASGYILYVSSSENGGDVYTATVPAGVNSVTYAGTSLNFNQQYFWHVAAYSKYSDTPNSVSNVYSFILTQ